MQGLIRLVKISLHVLGPGVKVADKLGTQDKFGLLGFKQGEAVIDPIRKSVVTARRVYFTPLFINTGARSRLCCTKKGTAKHRRIASLRNIRIVAEVSWAITAGDSLQRC